MTARDSSGAANAESRAVTFTVTVEAANVRPSVTEIPDQNLESGEAVEIEIFVTDDDEGDTHDIEATASADGIVEISLADSLLGLTALANGTVDVTVIARDDSGAANAESEPVDVCCHRRGRLGRRRVRAGRQVQELLRQSPATRPAYR